MTPGSKYCFQGSAQDAVVTLQEEEVRLNFVPRNKIAVASRGLTAVFLGLKDASLKSPPHQVSLLEVIYLGNFVGDTKSSNDRCAGAGLKGVCVKVKLIACCLCMLPLHAAFACCLCMLMSSA